MSQYNNLTELVNKKVAGMFIPALLDNMINTHKYDKSCICQLCKQKRKASNAILRVNRNNCVSFYSPENFDGMIIDTTNNQTYYSFKEMILARMEEERRLQRLLIEEKKQAVL